jgi:hypothetical protein
MWGDVIIAKQHSNGAILLGGLYSKYSTFTWIYNSFNYKVVKIQGSLDSMNRNRLLINTSIKYT